jgi:flagellar protein FliS
MLISKTIDIVNELASSLNMEKGGTLAENLNNLYFLCTARLLQANVKLDVDLLDSVASILSGLRSAYAQIVNTPEAKAASAQISARQNPQEAGLAKRSAPIMNQGAPAPVAAIGRLQAQAAYQTRNAPEAAPQSSAPAPAASGATVATAAPEKAPPLQSALMPPLTGGGYGKGMAAYGKMSVQGG